MGRPREEEPGPGSEAGPGGKGLRGEAELRAEVAEAARVLAALGLVTAFGHVSARLGEAMLITPGADLADVTDDRLVTVPLETKKGKLPPGAPAEAWAHLALYQRRADVDAIARAQPPSVFAAAAAAGEDGAVWPLYGQAAWLGERVPVHDDARLLRSPELAAAAAASLPGGEALLLRGNGALTLGATPGLAVARMWLLAASCQAFLDARATGTATRLRPAETASFRAVAGELLPRLWQHLRGRARRYPPQLRWPPGADQGHGTGAVMTAEPGWVPPGIDTGKANIARVYDYWLGGSNNFRADQDAARAMIAIEPNIRAMARANRDFMGRAVRFLAAEGGIQQFLDIGSGIPTGRNTHEVAQEAAPGARVVYADIDEVAVAHSRLLLENSPGTAVIQADVREPERILAAPETQRLIDFSQPVGLMLVSVLHFLDGNDDPWRVVAQLRDAIAPGSFLVLSHATGEAKPDVADAANTVYMNKVAARGDHRSRADILRLFDGFTLVEPGLVYLSQWRPDQPGQTDGDGSQLWLLGGVGRLDG